MENDNKPLTGIKLLDVSSILAGPTAGSFFAELGASVIKIENKKTGGDSTRQWKAPTEDNTGEISAYYASANTSKEIIKLDLSESADYQYFIELLKTTDVLISNFQKRVAEKLGITYKLIVQEKPDIIFAQLNAYEYNDPRPGYDLVMQAEAGWISMTGTDGNHLAKMPVALIDIIASHQIREATLIGLLKKFKTGKGSEVHISLYKSAISALANQAGNYLMTDMIPGPLGTKHPNIAPYGDIFTTLDKKNIILSVGSDKQFEKLGKTLNLATSMIGTFGNNRDRLLKREKLHTILQQSLEQHDLNYIAQSLSDANVPFCVVKNLKEVFENDMAKGMVIEEEIESVKTKKVSQIAFTFM